MNNIFKNEYTHDTSLGVPKTTMKPRNKLKFKSGTACTWFDKIFDDPQGRVNLKELNNFRKFGTCTKIADWSDKELTAAIITAMDEESEDIMQNNMMFMGDSYFETEMKLFYKNLKELAETTECEDTRKSCLDYLETFPEEFKKMAEDEKDL